MPLDTSERQRVMLWSSAYIKTLKALRILVLQPLYYAGSATQRHDGFSRHSSDDARAMLMIPLLGGDGRRYENRFIAMHAP